MKNRNFKMMPLAAIVLAAFGAFAFNNAPAEADAIEVWGLNPADCEETNVRCVTDYNGTACTIDESPLFHMNSEETACDVTLYKKF